MHTIPHTISKPFVQLVFMVAFSAIVFSSCTFSHFAVKQTAKAMKDAPYDVIIVPGVPYQDTAMSRILKARIIWAKQLYDKGITKNVIFSGGAVYTPYFEGYIMKSIADSMGMPANHTYAEVAAEHSTENVWNSMRMARRMGFTKIALATDPFQTKMIGTFLKKHAKDMALIPINFKTLNSSAYTFPVIDPKACEAPKTFVALPDREGFWERLRGTFGKHIKYDEPLDEGITQCSPTPAQ